MKRKALFLTSLIACMLVACNSLGIIQPESFDERWEYGMATVTGAREGATSALKAGAIDKKDAEGVLRITDQARDILDAAQAAESTNVDLANRRLELAIGILQQVQTFTRKPQ